MLDVHTSMCAPVNSSRIALDCFSPCLPYLKLSAFHFSHFGSCAEGSHRGFNLHFLDFLIRFLCVDWPVGYPPLMMFLFQPVLISLWDYLGFSSFLTRILMYSGCKPFDDIYIQTSPIPVACLSTPLKVTCFLRDRCFKFSVIKLTSFLLLLYVVFCVLGKKSLPILNSFCSTHARPLPKKPFILAFTFTFRKQT